MFTVAPRGITKLLAFLEQPPDSTVSVNVTGMVALEESVANAVIKARRTCTKYWNGLVRPKMNKITGSTINPCVSKPVRTVPT